jgi:hypothetical protein
VPNRIVREGILRSERVEKLSPLAELTYRRLMSAADDFGRFTANPTLIRAAVYPLRLDRVSNEEVAEHLAECERAGLIHLYEALGKRYLEILDFGQRTRATASKWPSPDGQPADTRPPHDGQMTVIRPSRDCHPRTETETDTETEAFDASGLSESLYELHPKKAGKILAQQALIEALSKTPDIRKLARLIEERHAAWCASPDWRKENGRYAPKLADWLRDHGWEDDPPDDRRDADGVPEWKGIPDAD